MVVDSVVVGVKDVAHLVVVTAARKLVL